MCNCLKLSPANLTILAPLILNLGSYSAETLVKVKSPFAVNLNEVP